MPREVDSRRVFSAPPSAPDVFKYLWIPVFLSLSKNLSPASANAQTILLPSDSAIGSRCSSFCPAPDPTLNFRPVIGIVSHPGDGASGRLSNATNASYIAASYVKFVESAGARVIPLVYNEPQEVLEEVNSFCDLPLLWFKLWLDDSRNESRCK
ncbi:Gamma-glutamyl hydrolase 2 [Asimina triloba]